MDAKEAKKKAKALIIKLRKVEGDLLDLHKDTGEVTNEFRQVCSDCKELEGIVGDLVFDVSLDVDARSTKQIADLAIIRQSLLTFINL